MRFQCTNIPAVGRVDAADGVAVGPAADAVELGRRQREEAGKGCRWDVRNKMEGTGYSRERLKDTLFGNASTG